VRTRSAWCSDVLNIAESMHTIYQSQDKTYNQSEHSNQDSSDGINRKEGTYGDSGAEGVTDSDRVSFVAFKVKRGTIISA
jgi:hypothetical protein